MCHLLDTLNTVGLETESAQGPQGSVRNLSAGSLWVPQNRLRNLHVLLAGYFLQCTSVPQAKLAVESSHQLAVPRCIMGSDGGLEGVAPNRWTTWTHLEGNQLVYT